MTNPRMTANTLRMEALSRDPRRRRYAVQWRIARMSGPKTSTPPQRGRPTSIAVLTRADSVALVRPGFGYSGAVIVLIIVVHSLLKKPVQRQMALLREGIEPLRIANNPQRAERPLKVYVNEVEFGLRLRETKRPRKFHRGMCGECSAADPSSTSRKRVRNVAVFARC